MIVIAKKTNKIAQFRCIGFMGLSWLKSFRKIIPKRSEKRLQCPLSQVTVRWKFEGHFLIRSPAATISQMVRRNNIISSNGLLPLKKCIKLPFS